MSTVARESRIVVAEAHAATRAGVRLSLVDQGFVVVGEASTPAEAVEASVRERPDICLLDADMPGDVVTAAAEILGRAPGTVVVMLGSRIDDDLAFGALRAGAQGYLLKTMDAARLPHALRGVLEGEAALPRTLVSRLIEEFRGRARRRHAPVLERLGVELTEREWEVLELLRDGLSTRAIGHRLSISPVTVRRHVSELLRKLEVPTREDAVALLEEEGVQD